MIYLLLKAAISGITVAVVSETAKRNPSFGALIASLPLISILGTIWIWHDTGDTARVAAHSEATFWFVLPSIPMFLILPALLRYGIGFWSAMIFTCLMTIGFYFLTMWLLPKFGVNL